ncbi:SusC/RagA family TonB-linked outer membrane protein [Pedobacter sp. Du54]|uniref:SusC/RagA family TonB-linked outer membrane protein n=1 Tax=Pedobacter anseongensis TaxID=3133439 RepID=UPI0030A12559
MIFFKLARLGPKARANYFHSPICTTKKRIVPCPSKRFYKQAARFILIFMFSICALTSKAQTVSLSLKNAPVETAFAEIKKQTGYGFWYEKTALQGLKPINVQFTNTLLKTALDLTLKDQPLSYEIVDRTIVVTSKSKGKPQSDTKEENRQYQISGKVTGEDDQPLAGATVTETALDINVQTDQYGNFSFYTRSIRGEISVRYVGYERQKANYQSGQVVNVRLSPQQSMLKAVEINAGYYQTNQRNLTGSISKVTSTELENQPVTNPLSALQGRTAGIQIVQSSGTPGTATSVIIRGQNGIETSTSPLFLVDGIPFGASTLTNTNSVSSTVYGNAGASPLNSIPTSEIESIEILRDADATAIYGSRGANGVVLITTKKGKQGSTRVNFAHSSGNSHLSSKVKMLQTEDYLALRKTAIALDGTTVKNTDYDLNGTWEPSSNTNWQRALVDNSAPFQNSSLSISGGGPLSTFLLSGSRNSQQSSIDKAKGYNRLGVHLSASQSTADKKLTASFSGTYSAEKTDWLNTDLFSRAMNLQPNAPALKNPDGSLNWANSTWTNPLRFLENSYDSNTSTLLASSNFSYRPIKDLYIRISLGYTSQKLDDRSTLPVSYYDPAEGRTPATSIADYNSSAISGWSAEPQVAYNKATSVGTFSILAGTTFQRQQRSALLLRGTGYASDALIENPRAATTLAARDNAESRYSYAGVYARLGYSLNDRYMINLTARRDASSRFGPGRNFANFGSIGAAWIFSEQTFVKQHLPFLSFGKLRASYGTTGSDQIGDYEFLSTYQSSLGYNGGPGLSPVRLFNPDFGWETNKKAEIAMDLGFFKDRVRFATGYYRNRSSNQLVDYPIALTTGFSSVRSNLEALIENTGWESELSATVLKGKRNIPQWTIGFNLTIPRNRLLAFPGLESSSYASKYAIGRPLSIGKLYHLLGVDPSTGLYVFQDFSGDGLVTALDRQQVIDKVQDYYGGLENSFSFRGVEISFLFQFVHQKANNLHNLYGNMPGRSFNQPLSYQGRYWTAPGDIAQLQRLSTGSLTAANTAFNNYLISDAGVSDASFIRLKNVALSYAPSRVFGGNLKLYLQGQNLWTITNYLGIDPESTNLSMPPLRTVVIGASLTIDVKQNQKNQ